MSSGVRRCDQGAVGLGVLGADRADVERSGRLVGPALERGWRGRGRCAGGVSPGGRRAIQASAAETPNSSTKSGSTVRGGDLGDVDDELADGGRGRWRGRRDWRHRALPPAPSSGAAVERAISPVASARLSGGRSKSGSRGSGAPPPGPRPIAGPNIGSSATAAREALGAADLALDDEAVAGSSRAAARRTACAIRQVEQQGAGAAGSSRRRLIDDREAEQPRGVAAASARRPAREGTMGRP